MHQDITLPTESWHKVRTAGDWTLWKFDTYKPYYLACPTRTGKPSSLCGGYYTIEQATTYHPELVHK